MRYVMIQKGSNTSFKVVFEEELVLTNVPETLKDELKQVQRSGKLIILMNSIFDYDYIDDFDFEQIYQIEGRYRVVSGQQEVIEGIQCCHVKFIRGAVPLKKMWPVYHLKVCHANISRMRRS